MMQLFSGFNYRFHVILIDCFLQCFFFFLEIYPADDNNNNNILVSTGESVMFICNISKTDTRQINWIKGRFIFAHFVLKNQTFSNFTSHRLRIDVNLTSKLIVSDVQHDDAGLYICDLSDRNGARTTEWNLTVSEKPEGR